MKQKALTIAEKIAFLQRAKELGNVAQACRELALSPRLYYKIKQQERAGHLEPLNPAQSQPRNTPDELQNRIVELSLNFPESGRVVQGHLAQEGITISAQTIQKILKRHGLGTQQERFERLIVQIQQKRKLLSPEQTEFLSKINPAWLEWEHQTPAPGELFIQYTHFLGRWPVLGKIFLYVGYETWSGWVYAFAAHGKIPKWPVQLFTQCSSVLSEQFGFVLQQILSSDTSEYYVPGAHVYRSLLETKGIQHRISTINGARLHGYTWRFQQWLEKNLIPKWKAAQYLFIDELNEAIEQDLSLYNHSRGKVVWPECYAEFPLEGFAPLERFELFNTKKY